MTAWHIQVHPWCKSNTYQRCPIGLRPVDCGGHLSTEYSCYCHVEEICFRLFQLWTQCWKQPSDDVCTVVIKRWIWSTTIVRQDVALELCSIHTKGPKCAKKNAHTLTCHLQPEPLIQGRMDPCFDVVYPNFWPYHPNVAAEIKSHQATFFPIFNCPICSACANCSLSFLFLADRSGIMCGLQLHI